jgi:recombination protein RecT
MASQAIAPREDTSRNPVALFQAQLESRAREIQMALPAHITPDKFQRTVMTAVAQNPDLLKADRQSLILACYKAAQDALLPDGREAALVTFNTRQKVDGQWQTVKQVQYMPMVYGLRKKILQSAEVVSLEVNVVYRAEIEKGTFLYEVGLEPPLRHRPSLDLDEAETSDEQIVAAYSIATMRDGTKSYEIMRRFEINKVRAISQTGATGRTDRQGNPIQPKGPWVDWFAEMAKKTVMRRHAKTLPMSGDVLIDVEGRELESGVSTAAALGSTVPDAPTAIADQSEETPHDPETGEVHDEPDAQIDEQEVNDEPSPAEKSVADIKNKLAKAKSSEAVETIIAEAEKHRDAFDDQLVMSLEVAFSQARARFAEPVQGELVPE